MKRWSFMSKVFTRIGKDISIIVKEGGADPETNSRLSYSEFKILIQRTILKEL